MKRGDDMLKWRVVYFYCEGYWLMIYEQNGRKFENRNDLKMVKESKS